MLGSVSRKFTALSVAISLCSGPAFASASTAAPAPSQISPMVALSIFGSQASATALCGSAATAAAASSAAMTQAPAGGCVLPVVDAPPPVPIAEAAPLPPPAGIGIAPILLALAGIAIFSALIFTGDKDRPPISVN